MDNKTTAIRKEKQEKSAMVTPTSIKANFFENNDKCDIKIHAISMDMDHDVDENDESTPLDFRRDWSKDLEDMNVVQEKEGQPVSTELYSILQKTIATIDPYDDFSDDDDSSSCASLTMNISSDVFNDPLDDANGDYNNKKIHLLKRLYHDRSHTMVETESSKRKRLN